LRDSRLAGRLDTGDQYDGLLHCDPFLWPGEMHSNSGSAACRATRNPLSATLRAPSGWPMMWENALKESCAMQLDLSGDVESILP
jgi:hypothetical protein